MAMTAAEISRAAGAVVDLVPTREMYEWVAMVSGAKSLDDISEKWRAPIEEAHAVLMSSIPASR